MLRDADFYWADLTDCDLTDCDTAGARFPEPVRIAYGPKGAAPPRVAPLPLYRVAATEEECRPMLAFDDLDRDLEAQDTRQ